MKYFACDTEYEDTSSRSLALVTDVHIQVAAARRFNSARDAADPSIDVRKPLYDIRGSYRNWVCYRNDQPIYLNHPGHACSTGPQPNSTGTCWADTFGDWHCRMGDVQHIIVYDQTYVPPPR